MLDVRGEVAGCFSFFADGAAAGTVFVEQPLKIALRTHGEFATSADRGSVLLTVFITWQTVKFIKSREMISQSESLLEVHPFVFGVDFCGVRLGGEFDVFGPHLLVEPPAHV